MIKKLIKLAIWLAAVLSLAGVGLTVYTLHTAQALFRSELPEPGSERYFGLNHRLGARLAVDHKIVGLLGGKADVRLQIADGTDLPLRVEVDFGPLLSFGEARFGLASWRVLSRYDIGASEQPGALEGSASFSRELALQSRVLKGALSLPFGAGRVAVEDVSLALNGSLKEETLTLELTAKHGRIVSPHQHIHIESARFVASALPVDWDDLGGRQQTPLSFARGEFSIEALTYKSRMDLIELAELAGEFDAKEFEETQSLEVFGQVGSLPVFSAEETGELGYSFLVSGLDKDRLMSVLRRDAELSRMQKRVAAQSLPEPIAGFRGRPQWVLWPDDPQIQQRILALVRGGMDLYTNLRLTQSDATAQLRFNTEFQHLGEGNSMMSMRNWGELFDHTLADFSFFSDHMLAKWPPIARGIAELENKGLIIEDKFGPSSSAFLRDGEFKINGEKFSVDTFLGESAAAPIPAVAALRRDRLRAVTPNYIQ